MLRSALRDLQWRRRRFAIATAGTALVFALTLVLTGLSNGFNTEASHTMSEIGADGYYVGAGASGPFLGAAPTTASLTAEVAAIPGIRQVAATVFSRKVVDIGSTEKDVNVFGATAGTPAIPATSSGRRPAAPGEIAISTKLGGYRLGDHLVLAGHPFVVVGKVSGSTALAGVPNVFLTLPDAQAVAFAGLPVASAFAYWGTPTGPAPAGLIQISRAGGRADLLRAMKQAHSAVSVLSMLLWLVAAMIVGSMIYLSALERQRDFAVFKATGVSTGAILVGLCVQAVVISLVAALVGGLLAVLLSPRFPMPVFISLDDKLFLPIIAIGVGLLASASGLRRVATVDPALAFGGA